ncbi:MAG: hypothetical protein AUG51_20855 [Acidobacteria bacterium 13_1_20CM_3_53_8]|nr:MAG: hypothetical protein AUH05_06580 [Ktedonobacter sp. 13_2_20CM_53_11]OLE51873.1 MAG: hypothetical protein AUG51_20855 [Acidobacteria bacterium 13_1_20CM_3_53_8]
MWKDPLAVTLLYEHLKRYAIDVVCAKYIGMDLGSLAHIHIQDGSMNAWRTSSVKIGGSNQHQLWQERSKMRRCEVVMFIAIFIVVFLECLVGLQGVH